MEVELMPWLERLGGWGALILVMRWMMTRLDKRDKHTDRLISALEKSVIHNAEFHEKMVSKMYRIHDDVKELKERRA